jgi:membrane protein implicated in regulation of membrane protease activity
MTPRVRYGIAAVIGVIGLILLFAHPIIGIVIIAAAIAVPVVGYRMLSPEQRRRLRSQRRRKQIGS